MTDPFDIVRRLYRAINARDLESIARVYAADAVAEQVFDGTFVVDGREAIVESYRRLFQVWRGTLEPHTIGGIQTGWGWAQADWIESGDPARPRAGHSHFLIEDGRIRRHKRVITAEGEGAVERAARPASTRRYPTRPITGVGAVIMCSLGGDPCTSPGSLTRGGSEAPLRSRATGAGVVLIKRKYEPLAGHWSLPGGTLDLGETLESATAREALEETGLVVEVGPLVEVFDRILLDEAGKVRYHFVLVDYLCRPVGGELRAGSDAEDVAIAAPADLAQYRLAAKAFDVIQKAFAMEGIE